MENFLGAADSIATQGAIYGAAGDGRVAFVDARDIAAVAVKALVEDGHVGKIYTISGPTALTFAEAAREIGTGIGREARYADLPDADLRGALSSAGVPGDFIEVYSEGYRTARLGLYDRVTSTIEELTHAQPRTLQGFARDYAGVFAGVSTPGAARIVTATDNT